MKKIKFKLGDSVVVKPNVVDPDLKVTIGGWQGRISEINQKDNLIAIVWDSLTLKQMSGKMIDQCEEEGLDWTTMYLALEDVELTNPRDNEDDVEEIIIILESQHQWSFLGEEGHRIQAVLANVKEGHEWAAFKAWKAHFQKVLKFPFEAEVAEPQDRGPLKTGERVKVLRLEEADDMYGLLVTIVGRQKYVFPLCDLEVLDQASPNYQPVKDYVVWFANR